MFRNVTKGPDVRTPCSCLSNDKSQCLQQDTGTFYSRLPWRQRSVFFSNTRGDCVPASWRQYKYFLLRHQDIFAAVFVTTRAVLPNCLSICLCCIFSKMSGHLFPKISILQPLQNSSYGHNQPETEQHLLHHLIIAYLNGPSG